MTDTKLSQKQLQEFDSESLQTFAIKYLEYLHSTPLFSTKTRYKFFKPTAKPSDHDILYGKNREIAYNELMDAFNQCILLQEFNKFFEDNNYHFWRSKTIPEIVIFKKWVMES